MKTTINLLIEPFWNRNLHTLRICPCRWFSFNRTILESKRWRGVTPEKECYAFNRTILESKRYIRGKNYSNRRSFNRTILESKPCVDAQTSAPRLTF